jgi:hypothetical protein
MLQQQQQRLWLGLHQKQRFKIYCSLCYFCFFIFSVSYLFTNYFINFSFPLPVHVISFTWWEMERGRRCRLIYLMSLLMKNTTPWWQLEAEGATANYQVPNANRSQFLLGKASWDISYYVNAVKIFFFNWKYIN